MCCLDSVLRWWLRLLGVFPVCDFASGRFFGLITGDPDPVASSRHRVVPVCNSDFVICHCHLPRTLPRACPLSPCCRGSPMTAPTTPSAPSPNGGDGRDARGRLAPGNQGGPGHGPRPEGLGPTAGRRVTQQDITPRRRRHQTAVTVGTSGEGSPVAIPVVRATPSRARLPPCGRRSTRSSSRRYSSS